MFGVANTKSLFVNPSVIIVIDVIAKVKVRKAAEFTRKVVLMQVLLLWRNVVVFADP